MHTPPHPGDPDHRTGNVCREDGIIPATSLLRRHRYPRNWDATAARRCCCNNNARREGVAVTAIPTLPYTSPPKLGHLVPVCPPSAAPTRPRVLHVPAPSVPHPGSADSQAWVNAASEPVQKGRESEVLVGGAQMHRQRHGDGRYSPAETNDTVSAPGRHQTERWPVQVEPDALA